LLILAGALAVGAVTGCDGNQSSDDANKTPPSSSEAPDDSTTGAKPGTAKDATQAETASETIVKKGKPIPKGPTISIDTVLSDPDLYAGKTVTVDGQVQNVCTRAGCWMELSGETPEGTEAKAGTTPKSCRVSFGHAFAVPRTSGGDLAKVHGVVKTRVLSPAMVQHLEEEGGSISIKLPDGSAREVAIVADGVELRQ